MYIDTADRDTADRDTADREKDTAVAVGLAPARVRHYPTY